MSKKRDKSVKVFHHCLSEDVCLQVRDLTRTDFLDVNKSDSKLNIPSTKLNICTHFNKIKDTFSRWRKKYENIIATLIRKYIHAIFSFSREIWIKGFLIY